MDGKISAIILAAGFSSRMGEFKQLLPMGDATVIERAVALFRGAGIFDVRVVVGHRAEDLLPILNRLRALPVLNDRYESGMFSSVVAGVASLGDDVEAFFLLPVDIPLVRVETIVSLVQAYRRGSSGIVYPVLHGKRGHPPLIAAGYRDEILAWSGEGGLKPVLMRNDDDSLDVETGDEGILHDMDTLADYDRLRAIVRKRGVPTVNECETLCDVFLMRHGDSRKDDVRRYIGQSDDPLNERGREQADWWRAKLSSIPFTRVYCSDLLRSRETARIIIAGREGLITSVAGLREISMGEWEGLAMDEARRSFPEEYAQRGLTQDVHRPPGGESFRDLQNRVIPVFGDIMEREEGSVLVVGHAGVNRVILSHVLGMSLGNLFLLGQDYGCLNILRKEKGMVRVDTMNLRPFDGLSGRTKSGDQNS